MIRLYNYSKRYSNRLILQVPELHLDAGTYWLKGENGSGKTTFLKSVGGLTPFSGSIMLQDVSIEQQPVRYRRLVSYAEAEPLYPRFLTGDELIDFYRHTRKATNRQVQELAEVLGVSAYSKYRISTYSSGMVKKLSLVLAFTGSPSLILLDEPFITLDQETLHVLPKLISNYRQHGISFIISSHQAFDTLQPTILSVSGQTIVQQPVAC